MNALIELLGKLPARIAAWLVALAAGAFVLLVAGTLDSVYRTKEPFEIAGLSFGPKRPVIFVTPPNAVVAFANDVSVDKPRDQCPEGWDPFEQARGRFIVGAGTPSMTDFKMWKRLGSGVTEALTTYQPLKLGGEETHELTIAEIPKHDHANGNYIYLLQGDGNYTGSNFDYTSGEPNIHTMGRIQAVGDNKPHNILPPYLPLYFCQKKLP